MRALAIVLLLTGSAAAQQGPSLKEPASDDDPLRRELDGLRARQKWLEQRLSSAESRLTETRPPPPPPPAPPPLVLSQPAPPPADDSGARFRFGRSTGFAFGTATGETEVRLRLVLHFDGRAYLQDQPSPDTFLMRRVRPFI